MVRNYKEGQKGQWNEDTTAAIQAVKETQMAVDRAAKYFVWVPRQTL